MCLTQSEKLTRGQRFEKRCLGKYSQLRNMQFINELDAIALVKLKQDRNRSPHYPSTKFGQGLIKCLKAILNSMLIAAQSQKTYFLKLYVAVDTPLDQHFGVDAFIGLTDTEYRHEFIVTLDLSLNPGKVVAKADFVINDHDADFFEGFFTEGHISCSNEKADSIANLLWMKWYFFNNLAKSP